MRKFTWLVVTGLAASTTGCIENMDTSGYPNSSYASNGYGNSYGNGNGYNNGYSQSSNGYYAQPTYYRPAPVNNYYYTPAPQVVTQTRYVPVPVPVPAAQPQPRPMFDRSGDHQRADRSHTPTPPAATTPTPSRPTTGQPQGDRRRGNGTNDSTDRDGDGKPDTPTRGNRRG